MQLRVFRTTPIVAIHTESNILPPEYWRSIRITTYYSKIKGSSLDYPLFQIFTSDFQILHNLDWSINHHVPFLIRACYGLSALHQDWGILSPLPVVSPILSWVSIDEFINISFPVDSKQSNSLIIKAVFTELRHEKYDHIHIYTDGSLIKSPLSCTAAVFILHLEQSFVWRLSEMESIFTAELFDILKDIQFSITNLSNSNSYFQRLKTVIITITGLSLVL